eukprot:1750678-Karenia_brevis.AAC.1
MVSACEKSSQRELCRGHMFSFGVTISACKKLSKKIVTDCSRVQLQLRHVLSRKSSTVGGSARSA